jgi:chromosomal replication initiator protein
MTPLPASLRAWMGSRPHSMCIPLQPVAIERRVMIADIQASVARHFSISIGEMCSDRRSVSVARPRQIAMYLAKRLTTRSLPEIGRKFGNRDHSTVIHAVRRIEDLRGKDCEIDKAVRLLTRRLKRRQA